MKKVKIEAYFKKRREIVERALSRCLPGDRSSVSRAMRYSVLSGGKRIRPILCLASCDAVGGGWRKALGPACSIELVHTYSLIHDDLPCMDDDDFRRGKPTCHRKFGEAVAVLAGDALLAHAFSLISGSRSLSDEIARKAAAELSKASGPSYLIAGQAADLAAEEKPLKSVKELEGIHMRKTAALIAASVKIGALCGGASKEDLRAIERYGWSVGLAFQVVDDLLDATGSKKKLGKAVRKDAALGKATYPALLGIEKSKQIAFSLMERAVNALKRFDRKADPLRIIAEYLTTRTS